MLLHLVVMCYLEINQISIKLKFITHEMVGYDAYPLKYHFK